MDKKYVLGLDFGSDSVRCIVVDSADGGVKGEAVSEYRRWKQGLYCNPAESRYRQHPEDYMESMQECVAGALEQCGRDVAANIVGLCFDTTASTPCLLDEYGTPLALLPEFKENPDCMFVLWKDHTAIEEAERLNELAARWEIDYLRTSGGTCSCEWVWPKMLHCLKQDASVRAKAWSWAEHGDWLCAILTGNTKPETMARSRCFAGHKALWNEDWGGLPAMDFLKEVDPLLAVFEGHLYTHTEPVGSFQGHLCAEWARRLGLKEGIAVGMGAIDCHVGAVGAGIRPGTLVKVMGTSTCDIIVQDKKDYDAHTVRGICGQVDGSVLPGFIGYEAGQAAFGDVYAWFARLLNWVLPEQERSNGRVMARLTEQAAALPLTAEAPVSTDWFNGRRNPDSDPRKRASITGLTLGTGPASIFKSLVEATAFGSRAIAERFGEEGIKIDRIVATGGISQKSPYIMQVMADVMGLPISVIHFNQTCALGSAILASVASGIYPDVLTAQEHMCPKEGTVYDPNPARHSIYNILYDKYSEMK